MSNYVALFIIASILNAFVTLISSEGWKNIELLFLRRLFRQKKADPTQKHRDNEGDKGTTFWGDDEDELLTDVYVSRDEDGDNIAINDVEKLKLEHKQLLRKFLKVYVLASFADWLQGPYVYEIYNQYGYSSTEIATLFVCGFASSMIFGSFVGSLADLYGRRKFVVVFSIVYSLSCLSKHFSNYSILIAGRLLGGIASSLLFSVFDSWLIRAHADCGLGKTYLSSSFSYATYCKFFVAILAGLIGNRVAILTKLRILNIYQTNYFISQLPSLYMGGCINVFDLATISATLSGIVTVILWDENYGSVHNPNDGEQQKNINLEQVELNHHHDTLNGTQNKIDSAMKNALKTIFQNGDIFKCGMVAALFEGSLFIFVFLWTPTLSKLPSSENSKDFENDVKSHLGLIFATFMVSCMTGSFLYSVLKKKIRDKILGIIIIIIASMSLFIVSMSKNSTLTCICFNIFETCVGIYFPLIGTIKSGIVPESQRVAIYTVFRIPLNMIVLISLLINCTTEQSFLCCALMLLLAAILLERLSLQNKKTTIKKSLIAIADSQSVDSTIVLEERKGPVQKHLTHRHTTDTLS